MTEQAFNRPLDERYRRVMELREAGHSFAQIGREYGVGANRVRQIYLKARRIEATQQERYMGPYPGLSVRAANTLRRNGVRSLSEAKAMGDEELLRFHNFGARALKEVREGQVE